MRTETEQLIEFGTFGRAQGLRGEIRFWAHNPESPLLKKGESALVGRSKDQLSEMVVNRIRRDRKGLFIGFVGCDDRTSAEALTGSKWYQHRSGFQTLEADELYVADLIGLSVRSTDGMDIGSVNDVVEIGPSLILLIGAGSKEIMVPYVDDFIERVALDQGVVIIKVLEGLLETGRG